MRDAHRMKEKLDVSLDNRQIVGLLVGGLLALGAVFSVGVAVGKNLNAHPEAQPADLLTAIDEKAAALDEPKADASKADASKVDASLTFQEELTKTSPDPAPVNLPPMPAPVTAPPRVADPVLLADRPPLPPPTVEPKPRAEQLVPVRTTTRDAGGSMKDALARAQKPSETIANGAFTLQLSASQDRVEADRFVSRLRDRGYAPYVVEAQVPGKGTFFRVRMGSFPSKEAANRYLKDFKRETQLDAFVAPNP